MKDPTKDKAIINTMDNEDKTEGGDSAADPTSVGWDGALSGHVPSCPRA